MYLRPFVIAALAALPLAAQDPCPSTPLYRLCELAFELDDAEAKAHPNPYLSVDLHIEFRSPRHRTFLMPAFWDGGRKMVVRFAPIDAGEWSYRVTSNVRRFSGKEDRFQAVESDLPGFIRPANLHHWQYTETRKPHLWMGDTMYRFATMDRGMMETFVRKRAEQKFTHIRGGLYSDSAFPAPDKPDPAYFREVDERVKFINSQGIILDLILGGDEDYLAKLFPTWQLRERFVRYAVARYSSMNITWQIAQEFEEYKDGRPLMKELGNLLKKYDPFDHPRTTHTVITSSPLHADGWMNYILYQSSDDQLGAIEHQLYGVPCVNSEFAYEDSGAGKSHAHHVDEATFRKRLWNASMNGQYPTYGNTGTYGGRAFQIDPKYLDSPGAKAMTAWFDFFSRTRYWELEPYFDVDNGRALALDDVEYVVYVEKPGPVEVLVQRHGYNVAWFNPITGEYLKQKDWKGDKWTGEPPSKDQDWVLHISREGKKEGMLRSYKFESRPPVMQEVEQSAQRVPFEIAEPTGDTISQKNPGKFVIKLKRETRATRSMSYLWTGEVAAGGQGFRVLATGAQGTLRIPRGITREFPAVMNVRLVGLNANGKAYSIDRVYRLTE
jgi:hypothetical protein